MQLLLRTGRPQLNETPCYTKPITFFWFDFVFVHIISRSDQTRQFIDEFLPFNVAKQIHSPNLQMLTNQQVR